MPFVIRPAPDSAVAGDPKLLHTIIEPDHEERLMFRDLHNWGWRVTQHQFGDDDYIAALKQIEKDVKRRRRQTHAIAGELYGYHERPSLEDIWKQEAEKMLCGSAYLTYKHEIEKNWLRAIDRTRQKNGFLDYFDADGKRPSTSPPAYKHYLSQTPREHEHTYIDPALDSAYLLYLQDAESARKRQESIGTKCSSSLAAYLRRSQSMLNIFPCKKAATSKPTNLHPNGILRSSTFDMSSIHSNSLSHNDNNDSSVHFNRPVPRPTETQPYLDPFVTLIFPGTLSSPRDYVRITRPGIRRSSTPSRALAPSLKRPGLGADPYGWQAWDEEKQRAENVIVEDVRVNRRSFMCRAGPNLNSLAMRKGGKWVSDVGPREMESEAEEILGRCG